MPGRVKEETDRMPALKRGRPGRSTLGARLLTGSACALAIIAAGATGAHAFWLLGFSTADTLPAGQVGFIAGTGGQLAEVGQPKAISFTPFLTHAGIRLGLADGVDVGYRLTQVAIPFSSLGATLGGEADLRYRLTTPSDAWQVSLLAGGAYGYLNLEGQNRDTWSPGVDLMASRMVSRTTWLITELRYVYTAIPTAPGGIGDNHLHAVGPDLGFKIALTPQVSLVPEMGIFDFIGRFQGRAAGGFGYQYGAVLSVGNLPALW